MINQVVVPKESHSEASRVHKESVYAELKDNFPFGMVGGMLNLG